MTDDTRVPPHVGGPSGSTLLRVQASSKLAFVATTAALVTLASGGTAVLVSHGTASLSRPGALLGGSLLTHLGAGAGAGDSAVVVERAPGTYAPAPVGFPLVGTGPTARAPRALPVRLGPAGRPTLSLPVAVPGGSQAGVQLVDVPQLPQVPVGPPSVVVLPVPLADVPGVPAPSPDRKHPHGKAGVRAQHVVVHPRDSDRGGSSRAEHAHSGPHPS